ncbi:MAG: phosphonate ABC transporter, permease protein PhnE [Verrucomicrobiae bacterium]|nr:phosphonate ABC transporter, permease protein PhnE [Verrucomicrobiae bacterium]
MTAPTQPPGDRSSAASPPRLTAWRVTLTLFALAVIFSWPAMQGSGRDLDHLANLRRFLSQFLPPDFSVSGVALAALLETARIAVMATFWATLIAVPLGAAAARNVAPRWLVRLTRLLLNGVRSLPSLVWALLAVAVVGANSLAGVIALTAYSLGYLGKFFSDAFESVDRGVPEALRCAGAHPIQAFQYGLWPEARPLILSHILWMIEYNIRSAAIIGYVGAGGIGLHLHAYQEFQQWDKFAAVLCWILLIVILLDFAGERLRHELTRRFASSPGNNPSAAPAPAPAAA